MNNENKKEFSSKYTLDYKTYKEFSSGYIATRKSSMITLFIVLVLLILCIIYRNYETVITFGVIFAIFAFLIKVTGRNKLQYKRYKSLNNNEFGNDNDAKRNMEYWANQETDNNIKPEYIVKSSRNYQKYVIDNEEQYVVLIRRDNFVFYGIGHTQYKEELDEIVNLLEEEMK